MDIFRAQISATQSGDRWSLFVDARYRFTMAELRSGFEFEHWITFWEWDESDHDWLTNSAAQRFRPTGTAQDFRWSWTNVPGDVLDTELGGEEIRGQVFLRNFSTSSAPLNLLTPLLQISPG